MNARLVIAVLPAILLLAACETTGDPREGGLFGWSEKKALVRQDERRREVAAAEVALAREQSRTSQLAARDAAARRKAATAAARAEDERERVSARTRMHEASVCAKAMLLEEESPTAATASRARKLRSQLEAVLANRALSARDRDRQLREIEAEIDEARAALNR